MVEIFDSNKKCDGCDRYFIEEHQMEWDFDRIFSGCCFEDIMTYPAKYIDITKNKFYYVSCKRCQKEWLEAIEEECSRCGRYILSEDQSNWDLMEIVSDDDDYAHEGTGDVCNTCEEEDVEMGKEEGEEECEEEHKKMKKAS